MKNCLSCSSAPFRAFSLVEMLMALLVASLLMAALAPVITRKLNDSVVISGSGENIIPSTFCGYVNDTLQDQLNEKNKACKVPQNTYSMNAIIVSGGGGGAGAIGKVYEKDTNTFGGEITGATNATATTGRYTAKYVVIDKYMSDIWVELLSAGGGGGYGNTNGGGRPEQQSHCGDWGVYVSATQNGGKAICVSRKNPEYQSDGKAAPNSYLSNVYNSVAGVKCPTATSANCCWREATSGTSCETSQSGLTYSGCNRMACQWNAANAICKNWKPTGDIAGRLPYVEELEAWVPNIQYNSTVSGSTGVLNKPNGSFPGLQLCDWFSGYGALQCGAAERCQGAGYNSTTYVDICYPDHLWTGTNIGGTAYAGSHFSRGKLVVAAVNDTDGKNDRDIAQAFSVRCVLDSTFKGYTGGGGGGGRYAKVKIPDDILKKAFIKSDGTVADTITLGLIAGGGGAGGTKEHPSGYYGYTSAAELRDANGKIVWKVYPSSGSPGNGAVNSSNGAGGEGAKEVMCGYVNAYLEEPITTDTRVECNSIPYYTSVSNDGNGSNNGTGGQGYWNGVNTGRTPAGAEESLNGGNGVPGAGGGGGICVEGSKRSAPQCGNGGSGGPGISKFTYKRAYPGVGGGGGAAGTLLHVRNIQVRPNDLITVQVGAKGMQGIAGANGKDGGTSYIQLADGTKYQVLGGGGGKAGTAGNPSTGKFSIPGKGGSSGGIEAKTKTYLNKDDEYYPKNPSDAKGADAPENDADMYKAAGGNGGINEKTFLAAGESENRIPCGGFSATSIILNKEEYKCETEAPSFKPFVLTRAVNPRSFSASVIQNYYLGATGGGGGGWLNDYSSDATMDAKSSGADGMGGYVFIYFGSW